MVTKIMKAFLMYIFAYITAIIAGYLTSLLFGIEPSFFRISIGTLLAIITVVIYGKIKTRKNK